MQINTFVLFTLAYWPLLEVERPQLCRIDRHAISGCGHRRVTPNLWQYTRCRCRAVGRRTLINLRHCTFVTLLINFIQAICWHTDSLKHRHAQTHTRHKLRYTHIYTQGRHTAKFASRESLKWPLEHGAISSGIGIGYRFGRGNKRSRICAIHLNLQIELKRKCINPIFETEGTFLFSHLWLLMQLLMGKETRRRVIITWLYDKYIHFMLVQTGKSRDTLTTQLVVIALSLSLSFFYSISLSLVMILLWHYAGTFACSQTSHGVAWRV